MTVARLDSLLFAQCPRALAPLGLKETETTATKAMTLQTRWRENAPKREKFNFISGCRLPLTTPSPVQVRDLFNVM